MIELSHTQDTALICITILLAALAVTRALSPKPKKRK